MVSSLPFTEARIRALTPPAGDDRNDAIFTKTPSAPAFR